MSQDRLVLEVYRSQTATNCGRCDSSGQVICPSRWPLSDNTQQSRDWHSCFWRDSNQQSQLALDRLITGIDISQTYVSKFLSVNTTLEPEGLVFHFLRCRGHILLDERYVKTRRCNDDPGDTLADWFMLCSSVALYATVFTPRPLSKQLHCTWSNSDVTLPVCPLLSCTDTGTAERILIAFIIR
jgi:hypothetical protein